MPRPLWKLAPLAIRERRSGHGRPRIAEPMVMDEPGSVTDFHAGGATVGGMLAVYDLNARSLDVLVPDGGRLLDLGTGSGRALQRFLAMRPDVTVTACDLAPNMLATARRTFDAEGMSGRVSLVRADITALPDDVMRQKWDAISCVWTLHHLPDRKSVGAALRQVAQLRDRDGSAVWLLDFSGCGAPTHFGKSSTCSTPACRRSSAPTGWRAKRPRSHATNFAPSSPRRDSTTSTRVWRGRSRGCRPTGPAPHTAERLPNAPGSMLSQHRRGWMPRSCASGSLGSRDRQTRRGSGERSGTRPSDAPGARRARASRRP